MSKTRKLQNRIMLAVLCLLVVIFITPILFIIMNSFKGKLYISDNCQYRKLHREPQGF